MTSRSDAGPAVTLTYTNHRDETAERIITPTGRVLFASNEWHPEPQWLVEAHDARSGEVRLFALTGFGKAPARGGGDEIAAATPSAGAAIAVEEVEWLTLLLVQAEQRRCEAYLAFQRAHDDSSPDALDDLRNAKDNTLSSRDEAHSAVVTAIRRLAAPQDNDGVREAALDDIEDALADLILISNEQDSQRIRDIADTLYRALKTNTKTDKPGPYQARVAAWQNRIIFDDPTDLAERTHRFTEEANELARALGQRREEAHQLVDYVYNQDHVGDANAEIGGTELTLAALCVVGGFDMVATAEAELARVNTPEMVAKIREKRSKRHGRGPLPGTYAPDFVPSQELRQGSQEPCV